MLVGSINGGQASNLCTLIAGGDVALSVPEDAQVEGRAPVSASFG